MDQRVSSVENADPQGYAQQSGADPRPCRRPAGRKPGPAPEHEAIGRQLIAVVRHCFPELNRWLDALTDPRCQALCVYLGRHIWWQIILTFILRGGSRNAFDGDRNTGELPGNVLQLCDQVWDEARLGPRRTVTCSENAKESMAWSTRRFVGQITCLSVTSIRRTDGLTNDKKTRKLTIRNNVVSVRALADARVGWCHCCLLRHSSGYEGWI